MDPNELVDVGRFFNRPSIEVDSFDSTETQKGLHQKVGGPPIWSEGVYSVVTKFSPSGLYVYELQGNRFRLRCSVLYSVRTSMSFHTK